jgi:hypothetical protein
VECRGGGLSPAGPSFTESPMAPDEWGLRAPVVEEELDEDVMSAAGRRRPIRDGGLG